MFKNTFLSLSCAAALAAGVAPAFASSKFFLVVPLKAQTQAQEPVEPITVSLAGAKLPGATVGHVYSESLRPYLQVTGDPAYDNTTARWAIVSGALPDGLSLDSVTGTLTGTPTTPTTEPVSFTVQVTYKAINGQAVYRFDVAANIAVTLASATLPKATVNQAYSHSLADYLNVTGDPALDKSAASWSLAEGTLPEGLTLSASGAVTGSPAEIGKNSFTLAVDYRGQKASQIFELEVSTVGIVANGIGRRFEDGSHASTCLGYLQASGSYAYSGATGSGVYTVDPDGAAGSQLPLDVYCDMTSDGGGWMLMVNAARNFTEKVLFKQATGNPAKLLNPASPQGEAGGFIGFNKWDANFPFSVAKITIIAGDNEQQRATVFKSIVKENVYAWDVPGGVETLPTVICKDPSLTNGCTNVGFDHKYPNKPNVSNMLILHGLFLSDFGYKVTSTMPVHISVSTFTSGACSSTGNIDNNAWNDSFGDGHWGNGMQFWFR